MQIIRVRLKELFSIDVRALAVFRICIALILILDILQRTSDLTSFHTDQGILPRQAIYDHLMSYEKMWGSPYFMSGEAWWIITIFVVTLIFCFSLLVGYRTRFCSCLCWLLLIALHDRNILVLHGGDVLTRVALLWSIFLPWQLAFSLDRLVANPSIHYPKMIFSMASIGYLLQVCLVYWSSAIHKWNAVWLSGKAIYFALSIDQFAKPFGLWLLEHENLLIILTKFVLFIELIGPCLAFFPFFNPIIRTIIALCFMFMHFLFGLSLEIGLFPYISMAIWIPFLPSIFWDKMSEMLNCKKIFQSIQWQPFVEKLKTFLKTHLKTRPLNFSYTWWENSIVLFFLMYIVLYNVIVTNDFLVRAIPRNVLSIGRFLHLEQNWGMFSNPLREDGWFVIPGKLLSGKEVDLFKGGQPVNWKKPPLVSKTFKNARWIKYMQYLWLKDYEKFRFFYAQYLCHMWNSTHQGLETLDTFQIYFMLNITHEHNKGPPEKILLWTHYCLAPNNKDKPS